jgi:mono/diheme cytochrome c family protein
MKVNGFPYTAGEIAGLADKTELDALIAYMQAIGVAVKKAAPEERPEALKEHAENPLAGDPAAIKQGAALYKQHCSVCHGDRGQGGIGSNLVDDKFLSASGDMSDAVYFEIISSGTEPGMTIDGRTAEGGMPAFSGVLEKNNRWALVSYLRSLQGKK